jgi:hypothetical protein
MEVTNAREGATVALAALKGWGATTEEGVKYLPVIGSARFVVLLANGKKLHVRVEEED